MIGCTKLKLLAVCLFLHASSPCFTYRGISYWFGDVDNVEAGGVLEAHYIPP